MYAEPSNEEGSNVQTSEGVSVNGVEQTVERQQRLGGWLIDARRNQLFINPLLSTN
jgi:hypothetical protein